MDNNLNHKRNGFGPMFRWAKNVAAFALLLGLATTYGVQREGHKRDHWDICKMDSLQNEVLKGVVAQQARQETTNLRILLYFEEAFPTLRHRVQRRFNAIWDSVRVDSARNDTNGGPP